MKHVVYLGSETGDNPIDVNKQAHFIQMAFRACKPVQVYLFPDVNTHNLTDCIDIDAPLGDILHISSHGDLAGIIISQPNDDKGIHVSTDQLITLLENNKFNVLYVDACRSWQVVKDIFEDKRLNIKLVIGHIGDINVSASYLGARSFHNILAKGGTYKEAIDILRETVYLIDSVDQLYVAYDESWISQTLLPKPPEVVARFATNREIGADADGTYYVEFGAAGFELVDHERCVVSFFSDDESLVGGAYTTVESGVPTPHAINAAMGTFWTNDYGARKKDQEIWEVDGDFRVFMSYFYDGEYDVIKSSLKSALTNYYQSPHYNLDAKTRARAKKVTEAMR